MSSFPRPVFLCSRLSRLATLLYHQLEIGSVSHHCSFPCSVQYPLIYKMKEIPSDTLGHSNSLFPPQPCFFKTVLALNVSTSTLTQLANHKSLFLLHPALTLLCCPQSPTAAVFPVMSNSYFSRILCSPDTTGSIFLIETLSSSQLSHSQSSPNILLHSLVIC